MRLAVDSGPRLSAQTQCTDGKLTYIVGPFSRLTSCLMGSRPIASLFRAYSYVLLSLAQVRKTHAHEHSSFLDVAVLVTQSTHSARLQHHTQRDVETQTKPSFHESSQDMPMRHYNNVTRLPGLESLALCLNDLSNDSVQSVRHRGRSFALLAFTTITPDVPRPPSI